MGKKLKLFYLVSFVNLVFFLFAELILYKNSWDLDNNLYFGSMLFEGDLLWTKEFHDKLPIVQYLFALPAYVKSIKLWIFLNYFGYLSSALFLYWALNSINIKSNFEKISNSKNLVNLICLLYICLPILLSGYQHFSLTATSFFSISLNSQIILRNNSFEKKKFKYLLNFISILFAALSGSIRPYFLPAISAMGIWIPLGKNIYQNKIFNRTLNKLSKNFLLWNLIIFVVSLIINFSPYVLTQNTPLILDGLILNSQDLNPKTINSIFNSQLSIFGKESLILFFVVLLISTLIFLPIKKIKKYFFNFPLVAKIDFFFICLFIPLSIESVILTKHFWPHYVLFFIPSSIYFLYYLLLIEIENYSHKFHKSYKTSLLSFFFVIPFVFQSLGRGYKSTFQSQLKEDEKYQIIVQSIKDISLRYFNEISFVDLGSQKLHWKLKHPRNGVPHPAHIKHLNNEWYKNGDIFVPNSQKNKFPLNNYALFNQIEKSGKKIIISNKSFSINQLLNKSSKYSLIKEENLSFLNYDNFPDLIIFRRNY